MEEDRVVAIQEHINDTLESWEVDDGYMPSKMESQPLEDGCMAEPKVFESDTEIGALDL